VWESNQHPFLTLSNQADQLILGHFLMQLVMIQAPGELFYRDAEGGKAGE